MKTETLKTITLLEESLWRPETRLDKALMDNTFADDIVEFGQSGQTYDREALLAIDPATPIHAVLPLPEFHAVHLSPDVVLVTYVSESRHKGRTNRANRSSIWCLRAECWRLRFHQGTTMAG